MKQKTIHECIEAAPIPYTDARFRELLIKWIVQDDQSFSVWPIPLTNLF